MHGLLSPKSSRGARGAVTRRDFLKGAAASGGLVIGFHLAMGP
ncbi:MAG: twin-arginine translocation signal domain-containing protein, partial [Betaproteobacteria bacterium]|nr:twin-arginine translocation signal domain-containing protein [Betaproteobacteria bacterium]